MLRERSLTAGTLGETVGNAEERHELQNLLGLEASKKLILQTDPQG